MKKDPVVRLSNEADVALAHLKHEALIKKKKRIYKNQILDWLILNSFNNEDIKRAFWDWVNTGGER